MIRSNKILKGGVDTTEFEIERDVLKEYKFPIFGQDIYKLSLGDFIDEKVDRVEEYQVKKYSMKVSFISLKIIDIEAYRNQKVFNDYLNPKIVEVQPLFSNTYVSKSQAQLEDDKKKIRELIELNMRVRRKIDELVSREAEIRGSLDRFYKKYVFENKFLKEYPSELADENKKIVNLLREYDSSNRSENIFGNNEYSGLRGGSKTRSELIDRLYDDMLKLEMRFMKKMLEEKHSSEKQAHLDESLASIEATFERTSSERKDEEETRLAEKARKIAEIEAEREKRRIEGERIEREKKEEEARLERERKEEEEAILERERKEDEDNKLFERFSKEKGIHHDNLRSYTDEELVKGKGALFLRLPEEFEELFDTDLFNGIVQTERLDGPLELNINKRIQDLKKESTKLWSISAPDYRTPSIVAGILSKKIKPRRSIMEHVTKPSKETIEKYERAAKEARETDLKQRILEAFLQSFKNREIYEKYEGIKKAETRRKKSEVKRLSNSRVSKSSSTNTRKKKRTSGTRRSSTLRRGTAMNSSGSLTPVPSARKKLIK